MINALNKPNKAISQKKDILNLRMSTCKWQINFDDDDDDDKIETEIN